MWSSTASRRKRCWPVCWSWAAPSPWPAATKGTPGWPGTRATWTRLMFFRHAIPECVNMLIDKRKQKDKTITKLGTDMAVPDSQLEEVMALYNRMLQEQGLEFGHLGPHRQQPPPCQHPAQRWGGVQKRPAALPPVGRLCDGKRGRGLGGTRCGQAESRVFAGDVRAGAHPADAPVQAGL